MSELTMKLEKAFHKEKQRRKFYGYLSAKEPSWETIDAIMEGLIEISKLLEERKRQ